MRIFSQILIVPLILVSLVNISLTGCASYYAKKPNVDEHIDALIERHRYDRALTILAAIPPEHEKYDTMMERIRFIEEKREFMIKEAIEEARAKEIEKDWAAAIDILDDALQLFPDEPQLKSMRNKYEALRLESIKQSNLAIMLARGRYLAEVRTSEERLLMANPDHLSARLRYRYYQYELKQVSQELLIIGRQAGEDENMQTAYEALTLSVRLHPSEEGQSLLSKIYRAQRDKRESARAKKASDVENQWPELETSFNQALQANDLINARQLLLEMKGKNPEKAEAFKDLLEIRIESKVKILQTRGRMLYEQGLVKESLDVWQEALQLKPDNPELMQNVHRAATFLENFNRWKK